MLFRSTGLSLLASCAGKPQGENPQPSQSAPEVFTGVGTGMGGDVPVTVTVEGGMEKKGHWNARQKGKERKQASYEYIKAEAQL